MQGGAAVAKALKTQAKITLAIARMKCDKKITQEASMSETTTTYELYRDVGLGFQKICTFDSEMVAKTFAQQQESRVEEAYEIRAVITTVSTLDSFTVPAHIPTIDEIAEDIISMSDGSFYVEWGEDYAALPLDDQAKVDEMVWQEIDSCACCGWHFNVWHLSGHDDADGQVCDSCYNELEEQREEEDE
jgi:hypothetical protein